jgi:hypothetical protein
MAWLRRLLGRKKVEPAPVPVPMCREHFYGQGIGRPPCPRCGYEVKVLAAPGPVPMCREHFYGQGIGRPPCPRCGYALSLTRIDAEALRAH